MPKQDELDSIIFDIQMHKLTNFEAADKLNSLTLKQVLELIGPDKEVTGHMRPQGYMNVDLTESYYNQFRKQLRQSAERIWS